MDENYKELIASRIKSARNSAGLKSEEAAKRAGVGLSRWLNWECGARTPKLDMIPEIAKAVGTTAAYLAGYTDHQGQNSDSWRYVTAQDKRFKSSDFLAFNVDHLNRLGFKERDVSLLVVRDNSLSPELVEGDLALINSQLNEIDRTAIYAIQDGNGHVWMRWIRPEITGGYTVYTQDKTHSPDQHFSKEQLCQLNVVGRYIGHWHQASA
nr:helix-turn-helix domain-containing protein [Vibrio sp. H11]